MFVMHTTLGDVNCFIVPYLFIQSLQYDAGSFYWRLRQEPLPRA